MCSPVARWTARGNPCTLLKQYWLCIFRQRKPCTGRRLGPCSRRRKVQQVHWGQYKDRLQVPCIQRCINILLAHDTLYRIPSSAENN